MASRFFTMKDPDKGYITNSLLIPKHHVNQAAVKNALTFIVGEETVHDELTGEPIGTRPREICLWDETQHHLVVPRAFLDQGNRDEFPIEWVEERLESLKHFQLPDKIIPRSETQIKALEAMARHRGGTVNLACGKGKTIIALKYSVMTGMPALVVVNTAALAHQWMIKIAKFIGKDVPIGHIQGQTCRWKDCPITISTVQTLANKRDEWTMDMRRYFGVVFFDEGHHMAAPHFVKAADLFPGQRFSLTATAGRTDGMEAISMYHLGGIIYQDLEQPLIPDTAFHTMRWSVNEEQNAACRDRAGKVHHRRLCIMLGSVEWRNALIQRRIDQDMEEGRQILVLTHSVEHTRNLMAGCTWNSAGMINGEDVDPFDRIPILEECNPVIGTFDLAREGLDKEELDTIYVTTPFGNSNDLQQTWGRAQRELVGKNEPLIRVYEDSIRVPAFAPGQTPKTIDTCVNQCRSLRKYLRVLRYPSRKVEERK